jgi:hypothetical protein
VVVDEVLYCIALTVVLEVDDAVAAKEGNADPTGGRGANGTITKTLEEEKAKAKEILKSAV